MKKTIVNISLFIIGLFVGGFITINYYNKETLSLTSKDIVCEKRQILYPNSAVGIKPKIGMVFKKEMAAGIAEAVWLSTYGHDIYKLRPYRVSLVNNNVWVVSGTIQDQYQCGGGAYIEIQKSDGKILRVIFGK